MTALSPSFSDAFSDAFDTKRGNTTFGTSTPAAAGVIGVTGDLYVDMSHLPHHLWSWEAAHARWVLIGLYQEAISWVSSHRLWEACLLLALRNYQVMNAPLGLAGGYDVGAVYVGRIDADYARLIKGYRQSSVPGNQEWPTVDEVAGRMSMSASVATTVDIDRAINAAIEQIFVDVGRTWGVG